MVNLLKIVVQEISLENSLMLLGIVMPIYDNFILVVGTINFLAITFHH